MGNLKESNKLEKHYTPQHLLDHLTDRLEEFINVDNITEFQENSAGAGSILDQLKSKYDINVEAYDIYNETEREDIQTFDYLKKKDIEYKEGRVCVMNPPFNKGIKFLYKSLEECDYTVCLLSINSFINIDYDKYEVDYIDVYKKADFGSCQVGICILGVYKRSNIENVNKIRNKNV
tara:strand:+ start:491 stop:1021 length:531 start_codon:yes stop_codon:yes gene_type:complete